MNKETIDQLSVLVLVAGFLILMYNQASLLPRAEQSVHAGSSQKCAHVSEAESSHWMKGLDFQESRLAWITTVTEII